MPARTFVPVSAATWLSILLTICPCTPWASENEDPKTCKDVAEKYTALKQTDQAFIDGGLAVSSEVHSYGQLCGPVCIEKLLPEFVSPAEAHARNPHEDVAHMIAKIANPMLEKMIPGAKVETNGLACETMKDVAKEFFKELGVNTEVTVKGVDEKPPWPAAPRTQVAAEDIATLAAGTGKILFMQVWTQTFSPGRIEYNLYLGHYMKLEKVIRVYPNGTVEVRVDDPISGHFDIRLAVEPANQRIYRAYFSHHAPKFWQDVGRYGIAYLTDVIIIKKI